jgi:hypothetical protein
MKKISLSIIAILFATASIMANGTRIKHTQKAKQQTCSNCTKTKCTKNCAKKADCPQISCAKN